MKKIEDYLKYYIGAKVVYEGVLNGKELKAEQKKMEASNDVWAEPKIQPIKGQKIGFLKEIFMSMDGSQKFRIGRKGLQRHYSGKNFKLLLRPLSSITEEELKYIALDLKAGTWNVDVLTWTHISPWTTFRLTPAITHYLLSRGFDLFDLIPSGLAIDASTTNTLDNE